jgi:hypothetical protein
MPRGPVHGAGEALGEGEGAPPRPTGAGSRPARPPTLAPATLGGLVDQLDVHQPVCPPHCGLDRVGQALARVGAHDQAIDHHRHVMLVLLVEHDRLLEQAQLTVDLHPGKAVLAQLLEELSVLPLAPAHHRGEHHEASALGELHDLIDDLLGGLTGDGPAAYRAVRPAHPGPQQAQVVIDLGDRAHRGAGIAGGGLLIDRDGRRQPFYRVHVGLVHLAQELAGVGGERLDVATLTLGIDGVKGQRGLPRARQPGDDDELLARQRDGQVLEVVLPGSRDHELIVWRHW